MSGNGKHNITSPVSACPLPITDHRQILLAHGGGGKLTQQLVQQIFVRQFDNELLNILHDGAIFSMNGTRLAFSTDSFVVNPIFFPGGDIGTLAVNGTVNDLAMCGAKPLYLSAAFILEEGFSIEELSRIVHSMEQAANKAGVKLVTGDTKVVDRGKGDKIFITTAGIGVVKEGIEIDPRKATVGDKIIVSGAIAQHGIAIMSVREGLEFETQIRSDTAPLNSLTELLLDLCPDIHVLRDPTRGGVAGVLNEIASSSQIGVLLQEEAIPVAEEVRGACEILGLDPLHIANEGKLLVFVPAERAEEVLAAMKNHEFGKDAAIIGEVVAGHTGLVVMRSRVGGTRVVNVLSGEPLPRIC